MRRLFLQIIPMVLFVALATAVYLFWANSTSELFVGLALSLLTSVLIHMLLRRIAMYRKARRQFRSEAVAREAAQKALADSEARYRSIFDSATDGLVLMDSVGVITEANGAACVMHGFEPGTLQGKAYPELIVPERRHLWDRFLEQLELVGTARLESRHISGDDASVDLEVRGGTFVRSQGEKRIVAILTDVSNRKRAEERLALLSRKILVVQEEERARIARELHDELGQMLTALRFELGWLEKRSPAKADADEDHAYQGAFELIEQAAQEVRHICHRLRPPMLDDLGLEPAVQQLVDEFLQRTGLRVTADVKLAEDRSPLPVEVTLCVYRVLQESLTNVGRHAKARSVSISLVQEGSQLVASIYDDGCGFDLEELPSIESSGITGMRERANIVGGSLEVRSAPFQGTRILLQIPLLPSDSAGFEEGR